MPKKWLNGSGKLDGLTNIFLEAFGPDFTAKVNKIIGSFVNGAVSITESSQYIREK